MPDDPNPTPTDPPADPPADPPNDPPAADDAELEQIRSDPAAALQTITALKAEASDWRRKLRTTEQERDDLKRAGLDEQERAVAEAEARGRAAAEEEFSRRTLEAEIRAAAAGRLQDPADAIRYLDVDALLEQDGSADLPKAIERLLADKPYLAVAEEPPPATRGVPRGSQGARSRPGGPSSDAADGNAWLRKAAGRGRR